MITTDTVLNKTIADYDLDTWGFGAKHRADPALQMWDEHTRAFYACLDLLDLITPNRTVTRKAPSSYGLKHLAERLAARRGRDVYVPNGMMILAIISRHIPFEHDGMNCVVGLFASDANRVRDKLNSGQSM